MSTQAETLSRGHGGSMPARNRCPDSYAQAVPGGWCTAPARSPGQHASRLPTQHLRMDPLDMLVDDREAAAGRVMCLREVLLQHTLAEARLVPGDVISLLPRDRCCRPGKFKKVHCFSVLSQSYVYPCPLRQVKRWLPTPCAAAPAICSPYCVSRPANSIPPHCQAARGRHVQNLPAGCLPAITQFRSAEKMHPIAIPTRYGFRSDIAQAGDKLVELGGHSQYACQMTVCGAPQ